MVDHRAFVVGDFVLVDVDSWTGEKRVARVCSFFTRRDAIGTYVTYQVEWAPGDPVTKRYPAPEFHLEPAPEDRKEEIYPWLMAELSA